MNPRPIVVAIAAGLVATYWLAPREAALVACGTIFVVWALGWGAAALKRRTDVRRRMDEALDGVRGFGEHRKP